MSSTSYGGSDFQMNSNTGRSAIVLTCPLCVYRNCNVSEMERHINMQHLDPLEPDSVNLKLDPPVHSATIVNAHTLKTHADTEHKNESRETDSKVNENHCPVCNSFSSTSIKELSEHVDLHFSAKVQPCVPLDLSNHSDRPIEPPEISNDYHIAEQLARRFELEQREFKHLQEQYGMDNNGNFKEQSIINMQRAVCCGELAVPDYHDKEIELKWAERIDIIPSIREKSRRCPNVSNLYLCSDVDFYSRSYGDRGWGCGYRNLQMLLSSLFRNETFNELLSEQLNSKFMPERLLSGNSMPCISKLQQMIEWAWSQGFDRTGCEQLGKRLHNTRKWIGPTEIVALLSALKLRCQLIDIHRPSADNPHHKMFDWIKKYFQKPEHFKPPLYLQHKGHSQTVVGIEKLKTGDELLLILDPGIDNQTMEKALSSSNPSGTMKMLRKSLHQMKYEQYQIATVVGIIGSKQEYEEGKIIRSKRIF